MKPTLPVALLALTACTTARYPAQMRITRAMDTETRCQVLHLNQVLRQGWLFFGEAELEEAYVAVGDVSVLRSIAADYVTVSEFLALHADRLELSYGHLDLAPIIGRWRDLGLPDYVADRVAREWRVPRVDLPPGERISR